jgi:hypothetical protein
LAKRPGTKPDIEKALSLIERQHAELARFAATAAEIAASAKKSNRKRPKTVRRRSVKKR